MEKKEIVFAKVQSWNQATEGPKERIETADKLLNEGPHKMGKATFLREFHKWRESANIRT